VRLRNVTRASALLACGCLLALGHHSTAPFDMNRAETVSGVVRAFHWANPHSYIDVEMMDPQGVLQRWRIEIEAANFLRRQGWSKDTLQPGDRVRCTGAPGKDPAARILKSFTVELPDGRKLRS
jgi:hypothetical protein